MDETAARTPVADRRGRSAVHFTSATLKNSTLSTGLTAGPRSRNPNNFRIANAVSPRKILGMSEYHSRTCSHYCRQKLALASFQRRSGTDTKLPNGSIRNRGGSENTPSGHSFPNPHRFQDGSREKSRGNQNPFRHSTHPIARKIRQTRQPHGIGEDKIMVARNLSRGRLHPRGSWGKIGLGRKR